MEFDARRWIENIPQQIEDEPALYQIWLRRVLREAVATVLTPRQRQIMDCYYVQRQNIYEIAQNLGVNPSTVSRTKSRALKRLEIYLSILPKR